MEGGFWVMNGAFSRGRQLLLESSEAGFSARRCCRRTWRLLAIQEERGGSLAASAACQALGLEAASGEGAKTPNSAATVIPTERNHVEQAEFLNALRHVLTHTEDVGSRFAEEARGMHYGELEARSIRGQTSVREAAKLMDEGIEVMPLPMLAALKETLQ